MQGCTLALTLVLCRSMSYIECHKLILPASNFNFHSDDWKNESDHMQLSLYEICHVHSLISFL